MKTDCYICDKELPENIHNIETLKSFNPKNLSEGKRQAEEEKANYEASEAKKSYTTLINKKEELERIIKTTNEELKKVIQSNNKYIIKRWDSIKSVVNSLNISYQSISNCLSNRAKTAGGFKWNYDTE